LVTEARSRILRYTPAEVRADSEQLMVDTHLGVDAGDLIGGYEAW